MGITQIGVRTKILDSIREIHKKEWDVTSLQAMEKHSLRYGVVFQARLRNSRKSVSFQA